MRLSGSTLDVGRGNVADATVLIDSASGGDPTLVFDTGATNRSAVIRFKDQGTISGFINYHHQYDRMDFGTGSSTGIGMSLTGGNLLVGKTSTSYAVEGIALRGDNAGVQSTVTDEACFTANRLNSDGRLILFAQDTATVGEVGTTGGDLYIGTGDTTLKFEDGSDRIVPRGTDGAQRDGAISLGSAGNRFKDLYLSGTISSSGLYFPSSNSRIYAGTTHRMLEGHINGSQLQLGEGYGLINLFKTQNASNELKLYNDRQDAGNVAVSKVSGYNSVEVANMTFYRGGGGASGYIRFQN